jgi:O-methyltransferase involved in polyketide biosynthesis
MDTKEIPALRGVQETLLFPVWGRAVFSRLYPGILCDREAVGIINSLDYDFGKIEKAFGEYGGLAYIIRARKMDDTIRHFISEHPHATVVNIGAGFDTTFSRIDNGAIRWYDLDISEVIALRKKIIPEGARNKCIARSVFDYSWMEDVRGAKGGILFIAGGVFHYFTEDKVRELFIAMAKKFPSGELYFDGQTRTALKISNRMVRKSGNTNAMMYFYINNPEIFASWSPLLQLKSAEPYFSHITRDRRWKISTRVNMMFCDWLKMVCFYHLKFEGKQQ